jgi:hypothetical protein
VDLRGIEPLTSSLRTRRATNCATSANKTQPNQKTELPCVYLDFSDASPSSHGLHPETDEQPYGHFLLTLVTFW